jgi:two-component system nitrate/nitrite response regulator NarL
MSQTEMGARDTAVRGGPRVLVVEDHPLIRNLIRGACEAVSGAEVVGEVAEGDRAVEESLRLDPDIIVLDLNLPRLDGLEVARRLRDQGCRARILVLTGRREAADLLEALRLGAQGFLDKGASTAEISGALQMIAHGHQVFTPEQESVAAAMLGVRARRAQEAVRVMSSLTPRQRTILALMAAGMSAKQIGLRLDISERSVRTHISTLYRRLGVRGRVEAVGLALELGVISHQPDRA